MLDDLNDSVDRNVIFLDPTDPKFNDKLYKTPDNAIIVLKNPLPLPFNDPFKIITHLYDNVYSLRTDYIGRIEQSTYKDFAFSSTTSLEEKDRVLGYLADNGYDYTYVGKNVHNIVKNGHPITETFAKLVNFTEGKILSRRQILSLISIGVFTYDTKEFIVVNKKFKDVLDIKNDIEDIVTIAYQKAYIQEKYPITEEFAAFLTHARNDHSYYYKPLLQMSKDEAWDFIEEYIKQRGLKHKILWLDLDMALQRLCKTESRTVHFDVFKTDVMKSCFCRALSDTEKIFVKFINRLHECEEALPPIIIWHKDVDWQLVFCYANHLGRFSYNNVNRDKDVCLLFKQTIVRPVMVYTAADLKIKDKTEHFIDTILNDIIKSI